MALLLIDNNDSFTYNLLHQIITVTDQCVDVVGYDELASVSLGDYHGYIISPGPGHPADYPHYQKILSTGRPVFGVCLGMQIINTFFGGTITRVPVCRHGVTVDIATDTGTFRAAVYNSLCCDKVPGCLRVTERAGGIPMALAHRSLPVAGVQYHPESFMTEKGDRVISETFKSIGLI